MLSALTYTQWHTRLPMVNLMEVTKDLPDIGHYRIGIKLVALCLLIIVMQCCDIEMYTLVHH